MGRMRWRFDRVGCVVMEGVAGSAGGTEAVAEVDCVGICRRGGEVETGRRSRSWHVEAGREHNVGCPETKIVPGRVTRDPLRGLAPTAGRILEAIAGPWVRFNVGV